MANNAGPVIKEINTLYARLDALPPDTAQEAIQAKRFVSRQELILLCQGNNWGKACSALINQQRNGIEQLIGQQRHVGAGADGDGDGEIEPGETELSAMKEELTETESLIKRAEAGAVRMDQTRYDELVQRILTLRKSIEDLDRRVHPPKSRPEPRYHW
jgi:hypothetical protein